MGYYCATKNRNTLCIAVCLMFLVQCTYINSTCPKADFKAITIPRRGTVQPCTQQGEIRIYSYVTHFCHICEQAYNYCNHAQALLNSQLRRVPWEAVRPLHSPCSCSVSLCRNGTGGSCTVQWTGRSSAEQGG